MGNDDVVALQEQVRVQREIIDRQTAAVARLEAAVEELRGRRSGPTNAPDRQNGESGPGVLDATTDRRHLLTKAATAAAGAVVGGAALAMSQASPVAAAISDTGNPAVTGTAAPTTGVGVQGNADAGIAVNGGSDSGTGVYGTSNSGEGVIGTSISGWGVWGHGTSNIGVYGSAGSGEGVRGAATTGVGVRGIATTGVAIVAKTEANTGTQFLFEGNPTPPAASGVVHNQGSLVKDVNEDLWYCTGGGIPGTFRRLAGPSTAGALVALPTPVRVYDSRTGFPPAIGTKAPLVGGVARPVDLKANSSGVPAGATAVLVNLVVTNTTGSLGGFLAIYRNGIAWPGTSNLNWSGPDQNVAVTTLTAVDATAICNLYANVATNVVVDVLGYYR